MNELPDLSRSTGLSLIVHHENFRVRDSLAYGGGATIKFFGREIRGTKRFRESVHEKDLGCRQQLAKGCQHRLWHRASCIRDIPEMRKLGLRQRGIGLCQ